MTKGSVSKHKWLLYAGSAFVLMGANIWRWQGEPTITSAEKIEQVEYELALPQLPLLFAAQDFKKAQRMQRDLFQQPALTRSVIVAPVEAKIQPAQPDPMVLLQNRANALLDTIEIQGIISSPDGLIALLHFEGTLFTLKTGDEFIAGYTIAEISTKQLRVENKTLSIQRLYTVGEWGLK